MLATVTVDGNPSPATTAGVAQLLRAKTPLWLDLNGIDDEATALLTDTFRFHSLAVEDAEHFGQRPKIEEFDDFTYFVVHGMHADGSGTSELHIFYMANAVVTVHQGDCPALDEVRTRIEHRHALGGSSSELTLVYVIVDTLVDTYFPALSGFDDRIDDLEDQILQKPTEAQLGVLFNMKRTLIGMRKVVTPQRDMFAGLAAGIVELPGMTTDGQRYFRDLYDHLIRIADAVDSYRDLLSDVMDTHVSTVSNRLNVVMKQLTIIATVFLPLSFLTGFFGQNFSFLVGHVTGAVPFLVFGIGIELVTVGILVYYFRRKGWLGGPTN